MEPQAEPQDELIESLTGDFVQLNEKALRRDGTAALRLIAPGWGSSGFYPADVLERDGPQVFKAGTKMFWNHPTMTEEAERPEGSLGNLAAVLVDDARWDGNGPEGPGLYANAKVFEGFRGPLEEMAPHIGVSIRAAGRAQQGEAEGRKGAIITEISSRRSVDFVTDPGAGGRIIQMFEAAGRKAQEHETSADASTDNAPLSVEESEAIEHKEIKMEEQLKELQEALTESQARITALETDRARLAEALLVRDAQDVAREALAGASLPDVTKRRLLAQVTANPAVVDGKLDRAAMIEAVKTAIEEESTYLQEAAGWQSGRIEGMGSLTEQAADTDAQAKQQQRMVESFRALGLSEGEAAIAAVGRLF